jgi:hypothetical protein
MDAASAYRSASSRFCVNGVGEKETGIAAC